MGGAIHCHGTEEVEAIGNGVMGKRRVIWGKIELEMGIWVLICSPVGIFFSPRVRVMSVFWNLILHLCNSGNRENRVISPGPLPRHPRRKKAKCQDMQMSLWGSNRQEELMAASPPIPRSTIKYLNGILLRRERQERFPDDTGGGGAGEWVW